jgi:hypothetical protein
MKENFGKSRSCWWSFGSDGVVDDVVSAVDLI